MGASELPLNPAERLQHALDLAYRYLGFRDRTVREMRRHLEGKGVGEGTVGEAVAELAEQGYLDDARFARRFAEDRRTLDSWGAERIERKLRDLGVDGDLIAAAIAGGEEGHDELGAAVELLQRRLRAAPASDREREKALGLLVRRGYDLEVAYDAVRAFERA